MLSTNTIVSKTKNSKVGNTKENQGPSALLKSENKSLADLFEEFESTKSIAHKKQLVEKFVKN